MGKERMRRRRKGRDRKEREKSSEKSSCPSSAWSQGPNSSLICYDDLRLFMQIQENMDTGKEKSESHSVMSDSATPWRSPWNSPGQNTGEGSLY